MSGENVTLPIQPAASQERSVKSLTGRRNNNDHTNAAFAAEVKERLWKDRELRVLEGGHIRVEVNQGIARLYGHVVKPLSRIRAQEAALAVRGVTGVQNELVVDDDLRVCVASALAKDECTRRFILPVGSSHGWISLGGRVPDAETRAAAEAISASVPQVRGVIGLPTIPGERANPLRRTVQPEIGWTVYSDYGAGRVTEVLIDPCSRLVTHVVVSPREGQREQKEILLPVKMIDFAREGAIWLKAGVDFKDFPEFDASQYPIAPEGWRPPFPYGIGIIRWSRRAPDSLTNSHCHRLRSFSRI